MKQMFSVVLIGLMIGAPIQAQTAPGTQTVVSKAQVEDAPMIGPEAKAQKHPLRMTLLLLALAMAGSKDRVDAGAIYLPTLSKE